MPVIRAKGTFIYDLTTCRGVAMSANVNKASARKGSNSLQVLVRDLLVRIGYWPLELLFCVVCFTDDDPL